ncbi:hypothetical protein [Novosphingobium guangzhouense]|uniref:Glycosyltransferase RgtA/B/C/D-like domain-containing protein n=1 Tax=Novosphingobium guangzhouense TaxID=1850347 RepID=A0A2K2G1Z8_9SPHN|nr:hypothetical protein [Novosphingobium guangzhouense]PNU05069.1 hypothetical protein A8V01_04350 [Novosphingobium guangzhouense]
MFKVTESRIAQFICLLAFATLIRCPAWGEWNFGIDDQFYALVGERLTKGDLLYVDIWDRKGPLLYLIFAALALISPTMLTYQLAATGSAALGAYGVNRIARLIATPGSAMLAGLSYLALLSRFEGDNLEAGVFFNTLVIGAAWLLVSRFDLLRRGQIDFGLIAGFMCAGMAIAIKQTVALEGALFGITALLLLARSGQSIPGTAWRGALLALAGALPMLVTGLSYWANGHFAELWNAMVTSNFARGYADPGIRVQRIFTMAGMLGIPMAFAGIGIHALLRQSTPRSVTWLVTLWAVVALALIFSFPNIYVHYAQSALAPLAILCAGYFAHRRPVWPGIAAVIGLSLALSGTLHIRDRWRARPAAAALVSYVTATTPHKRLLVWGAPNYLYAKIGADPVSPLAFSPHLYEGREWTGLDERKEVRRILAHRPETVVMQTPLPSSPLNEATVAMVNSYVATCRKHKRFTIYDHNGEQVHTVFSGCGAEHMLHLHSAWLR